MLNKINCKSKINWANTITWSRILCLPLMVVVYELHIVSSAKTSLILGIAFAVLAITDWLDGFIARSYGMASDFGAFLDPVADKIMVVVSLLIVLDMALIHYWVALVIILRELIISALREWMAIIGSHDKVAVRYIGKLKTTAQMLALQMLLLNNFIYAAYPNIGKLWHIIAGASMYTAAALTIWSMFIYLRDANNSSI
jgi:CDP-diacylglycerol--glycerol-3-phosphate 3-phosphatidyltransferase